ncbi:hypothetical protein R3P38DRAFT_3359267 [Favolaschia claudopus]|uniref:Uncharacterized protein n=1 Tax=Favolaschia claudopus TaxID=2862362 RepID=A0AAW0B0U2_9AGAR
MAGTGDPSAGDEGNDEEGCAGVVEEVEDGVAELSRKVVGANDSGINFRGTFSRRSSPESLEIPSRKDASWWTLVPIAKAVYAGDVYPFFWWRRDPRKRRFALLRGRL